MSDITDRRGAVDSKDSPITKKLLNHDRYLHEADVERQLTLESYGYRFLRLNRFNLGTDQVAKLSERLEQIAASAARADSTGAVKGISQQAEALTDKSAKVCERCGAIKPMALFFDKTLGGARAGTVGFVCPVSMPNRRVWARGNDLAGVDAGDDQKSIGFL
jgi:hypothetical protein